ncbi:MAG: class I SAM-dependent methyltransferase [Paracoccaceae bacterium]
MLGFTISTFGELNAEEYDELQDPGTTDQAVALISEIANGGSILELAIGTGRIALPLQGLGHKISGIEGSPEMVAKLREKPGGDEINVVIGDMADVEIDGTFDHVCLVFNTLFNLPTQDAQLRCFSNVAEKLKPGGTFLVETFVPDLSSFKDHQHTKIKRLDKHSVWIEAATHDPVQQTFEFQRIRFSESSTKLVPLPMRYAWPSEMDLMAKLAGLELTDRWGSWDRNDFDADSKMHISVYQKPS